MAEVISGAPPLDLRLAACASLKGAPATATMRSGASSTRAARPDLDHRLKLIMPPYPRKARNLPPFDGLPSRAAFRAECAKLAQSYNMAGNKAKIRLLPKC